MASHPVPDSELFGEFSILMKHVATKSDSACHPMLARARDHVSAAGFRICNFRNTACRCLLQKMRTWYAMVNPCNSPERTDHAFSRFNFSKVLVSEWDILLLTTTWYSEFCSCRRNARFCYIFAFCKTKSKHCASFFLRKSRNAKA